MNRPEEDSMTTVKVTFTDDEKKAIQQAARAVWEECAYDILQMTADEQGKDINAVSIPRRDVMEIALDADRTEERLRQRMYREMKRDGQSVVTNNMLDRMRQATYSHLIRIVQSAFPSARYGM
jgi:hypothetical protein